MCCFHHVKKTHKLTTTYKTVQHINCSACHVFSQIQTCSCFTTKQQIAFSKFKFSTCKVFMARFPFWSMGKRQVATNIFSYKRYGGILFQKVALCYWLHFVPDGSSKKRTRNTVFCFLFREHVKQNVGNNPYIFPPP